MKCRGNYMKYSAYSITFSPLHFMLYRRKSITFGTVYHQIIQIPKRIIIKMAGTFVVLPLRA